MYEMFPEHQQSCSCRTCQGVLWIATSLFYIHNVSPAEGGGSSPEMLCLYNNKVVIDNMPCHDYIRLVKANKDSHSCKCS